MRPALRYRRACWASTYRFCVAQPCPRLYEAFHLERVTALSGRQKSGAHVYIYSKCVEWISVWSGVAGGIF